MKLILSIIVALIALQMLCLSHNNENVHQRIVIEAYKLLKLQLSKENSGIADIELNVGGKKTTAKMNVAR